jgi:hypothetical protein
VTCPGEEESSFQGLPGRWMRGWEAEGRLSERNFASGATLEDFPLG